MGSSADDIEDVIPQLRDALYTTIGFGVLGVQRFQVARRELTRDARAGLAWALPLVRRLMEGLAAAEAPERPRH